MNVTRSTLINLEKWFIWEDSVWEATQARYVNHMSIGNDSCTSYDKIQKLKTVEYQYRRDMDN